jgi:hypothetical protein
MALVSINKNPDRRTVRQFAALWLPLFLALVGLLVFRKTHRVPVALAVAAAGPVLGALAFFVERFGRALFVAAQTVTYPIGLVVSTVILLVLYFGVITPIGLVRRVLGRDAMERAFDRSATTYWVERGPARSAEDYFRQY